MKTYIIGNNAILYLIYNSLTGIKLKFNPIKSPMILCFYSKVEFKELSISILEEIDLSTDKLFVIDVKCKRLNIVRKPITIGNDKPVKLAKAYLRNYLGGLYWHSNYTNWRKYYFEFCERNELT